MKRNKAVVICMLLKYMSWDAITASYFLFLNVVGLI